MSTVTITLSMQQIEYVMKLLDDAVRQRGINEATLAGAVAAQVITAVKDQQTAPGA